MDKEKIIEMIKALGLTAEELGFTDTIKRDTEFDELVKRFIDELDLKDKARDYFPEKYHEILNVKKEEYKVVKVQLSKVIYKDVLVVMPEEEDEVCNIYEYLPSIDTELDTDHPDSEDEWDAEVNVILNHHITADEVKRDYSDEEIWNYDNFERR